MKMLCFRHYLRNFTCMNCSAEMESWNHLCSQPGYFYIITRADSEFLWKEGLVDWKSVTISRYVVV